MHLKSTPVDSGCLIQRKLLAGMWQIQGLLLKLRTSFSPSVFDPWLVESQMQSLWLWRLVRVCVCACMRARVCAPAHLRSCPYHQNPCPRPPNNVVAEFSAAVPGGGSFGVFLRGRDLALKVKKVATILSLGTSHQPLVTSGVGAGPAAHSPSWRHSVWGTWAPVGL